MTILSDEAILSALDVGELEIDPFNSDNLTPNGYDLTIKEIEIPNISKIEKGDLIIPPGKRFAISTTSGSSGFGSTKREHIESSTFEIVSAGLH